MTELYSHLLPGHLERARNAVVLPTPVGLIIDHETHANGRHKPQARRNLSDAQVVGLRKDCASGSTFAELGKKYGISKATARSVAIGDTYSEVG